jgi:hypothetical protein
MQADRPAHNAEVEVTPQMAEAGAETIMSYGLALSRSSAVSLAEDVFRVMVSLKRKRESTVAPKPGDRKL